MDLLIKLFNELLTSLFVFLIWPFRGSDPIWALVFISFLAGVLMLWVFARVSNQEAIRRVRERIRGNLLGIRLYQHDVRVLMQVQFSILRDTLIYMKHSVVPMLILIFPVILIIVQLNLHFSHRPVEAGRAVVVKVKLTKSSHLKTKVYLNTPPTVNIETPPVHITSAKEIAWRIRPERPGCYSLTIIADRDHVEKELCVGEGWRPISVLRTGHLNQALLYPGEPPINSSEVIDLVEITYGRMNLSMFGWDVHWLFIFFFVSIVSAYAFKHVLKVEI